MKTISNVNVWSPHACMHKHALTHTRVCTHILHTPGTHMYTNTIALDIPRQPQDLGHTLQGFLEKQLLLSLLCPSWRATRETATLASPSGEPRTYLTGKDASVLRQAALAMDSFSTVISGPGQSSPPFSKLPFFSHELQF